MARRGLVRRCTAWRTARRSAAERGKVGARQGEAWSGAAWLGGAWSGGARPGLARHGLAWLGVAWLGRAWQGRGPLSRSPHLTSTIRDTTDRVNGVPLDELVDHAAQSFEHARLGAWSGLPGSVDPLAQVGADRGDLGRRQLIPLEVGLDCGLEDAARLEHPVPGHWASLTQSCRSCNLSRWRPFLVVRRPRSR
jgi:hypothetical protein